jgi:hypothetical protein
MNEHWLEKITEKLQQIADILSNQADHHWYCGCGHWNGANLMVCARCGSEPNEL